MVSSTSLDTLAVQKTSELDIKINSLAQITETLCSIIDDTSYRIGDILMESKSKQALNLIQESKPLKEYIRHTSDWLVRNINDFDQGKHDYIFGLHGRAAKALTNIENTAIKIRSLLPKHLKK